MALKNISLPDDLSGNDKQDIEMLHGTVSNAISTLNYILSNIDEENLTEDIINKLGD